MVNEKVQEMLKGKAELVQRKYSQFAQKGNLWEINSLVRQTGIAPQLSDQELSILYLSSAKADSSEAVNSIKQLQTLEQERHEGKTPVFDSLDRREFEAAMQEGYAEAIARDWSVEKKVFDALKSLTGVSISKEAVQEAIDKKFKAQNILGNWYFNKIKEATGFDLRPTLSLVQKMYRDCLAKESIIGQSLFFWEYIAKATGIKPSEELAQKAYRFFLRKNQTYNLMRFVEFLGIKPKEDIVQETYLALSGDSTKFKELEELTGVKPREEIIHKTYSDIVGKKDSIWAFYFRTLFEQTGVMPAENLVQGAYAACIKEGRFDGFNELYAAFKIEPSAEVGKTLERHLAE